MAILISSKRRVRQIEIETKRNIGKKSRVHNARRAFMDSIEAKDQTTASEAFKKYCSALDRAAKHNIIKKNTAIRRKKRAAAKLRTIA